MNVCLDIFNQFDGVRLQHFAVSSSKKIKANCVKFKKDKLSIYRAGDRQKKAKLHINVCLDIHNQLDGVRLQHFAAFNYKKRRRKKIYCLIFKNGQTIHKQSWRQIKSENHTLMSLQIYTINQMELGCSILLNQDQKYIFKNCVICKK